MEPVALRLKSSGDPDFTAWAEERPDTMGQPDAGSFFLPGRILLARATVPRRYLATWPGNTTGRQNRGKSPRVAGAQVWLLL